MRPTHVLCLFAFCFGCASASEYQYDIPARARTEMPAPSEISTSVPDTVAVANGKDNSLYDAVIKQFPPGYRKMLIRDKRLDAAAQSMAWIFGVGQDWLHYKLKYWVMAHHGIHQPSNFWAKMGWNSMGTNAKKRLSDRIKGDLNTQEFVFMKAPHRVGFAAVQTGARTWAYGLLITEDIVQLDPFKRSAAPNSKVTITGQFDANWAAPKLAGFASPTSAFEHVLKLDSNHRFSTSFVTPKRPGSYLYELRAYKLNPRTRKKAFARDVIGSFRLHVGVPIPQQPSIERKTPSTKSDMTNGEQHILNEVNKTRKKNGLNPVELLPELAPAALALAKELRSADIPEEFTIDPLIPEAYRQAKKTSHWGSVRNIERRIQNLLKYPSLFESFMNPKAYSIGISLHNKPNKDGDDDFRYGIIILQPKKTTKKPKKTTKKPKKTTKKPKKTTKKPREDLE